MATWNSSNTLLTTVGAEILSKVQSGVGSITISRVVTGAGYVDTSALSTQTEVSSIKQQMTIVGNKTDGSGSTLNLRVTNENLSTGYLLYQIGVYVTHPDYTGEKLYLIAQVADISHPDQIPAASSGVIAYNFSLYMEHLGSSTMNVTIDPAGALPISGGTVTGDLTVTGILSSPTSPTETSHATNKGYVDGKDSALSTSISNTQGNLDAHISNAIPHVSSSDRTSWNGAVSGLSSHKADSVSHTNANERTSWNGAVTGLASLLSSFNSHSGNSSIHVSSGDRTSWTNTATDFASHKANTTLHITADERLSWNGAVTNLASHVGSSSIHVSSDDRASWATMSIGISSVTTGFNSHKVDTALHVTSALQKSWNDAVANLGTLTSTVSAHTGNADIHVTAAQKTSWTNAVSSLSTLLGNFNTHSGDSTIHVTSDDKTNWNGASTKATSLYNDFNSHSGNTTIHLTSAERTSWNDPLAKLTSLGSKTSIADADKFSIVDTSLTTPAPKVTTWSTIKSVLSSVFAAKSHTHSVSEVSGAFSSSGGTISGTTTHNGAVVCNSATYLYGANILSSNSYGTSLPSAGNAGRIFFKKV